MKTIKILVRENRELLETLSSILFTALIFVSLFIVLRFGIHDKSSIQQNIDKIDQMENSMLAQPECTDGLDYHDNPVTEKRVNKFNDKL